MASSVPQNLIPNRLALHIGTSAIAIGHGRVYSPNLVSNRIALHIGASAIAIGHGRVFHPNLISNHVALHVGTPGAGEATGDNAIRHGRGITRLLRPYNTEYDTMIG